MTTPSLPLRPEDLHTKESLRPYGIGDETLLTARQCGAITPRKFGVRNYYLGSEVIAYIVSRNDQPRKEVSDG